MTLFGYKFTENWSKGEKEKKESVGKYHVESIIVVAAVVVVANRVYYVKMMGH